MDLMRRSSVLVVDDSPDNLKLIGGLLKDLYRVKIATDGEKALAIARGPSTPDLILLDVMMPGMSGYDVCRLLKSDPLTQNVPIIFLTALSSDQDESEGLEIGGADYVTKPVNPRVLLARVKTQIENKASSDFIRNQNDFLDAEVQRRTLELTAIQDVTILSMASLAETRDSDTGNHILRTQYYVRALAEALRQHPRFRDYLTHDGIDMLFKSAPLHDIGKVGIPDHILLKPGRLTIEEFEIMKTHTTLGRDALQGAENSLGTQVGFLEIAKEIAYCHQEKWDGSGYPQGLSGDDIPISARLMAVADVYDALISRRVYKEGMTHEEAIAIITDSAGTHFDPDIVEAFLSIDDEFRRIALRYTDSDEDLDKKRDKLEQIPSQNGK
ncbi:two-component system response regulator [Polynucleobacter hirudinilacicola]|uniref:Two-component system response regulator n=2 Tax=Polynucleobacter hirudinilacicola TaxID=1743166 RepID=A0A210S0Y1_9BURK|nr:two-component system response regulator [Polynucleobacter hirudinilacicola]